MCTNTLPDRPALVDKRRVAVDETLFLEGADPAQAGGFRQVYLGSELHVADAAVTLQGLKNVGIVAIEYHSRKLRLIDILKQNLPKICLNTGKIAN